MKYLLERAALWKRRPAIYLFLIDYGKSIDISNILYHNMHELHVIGTGGTQSKNTGNNAFVSCPFLTHLSITENVTIYGSVMLSLAKAVREGELSSLRSFNFVGTKLKGRIGHFFDGKTILSTVTNLNFYDVDKNDIKALSQNWINVESLSINTLTKSGFRAVMKHLGNVMLPNLRKLCLSMIDTETIGLETVKPEKLPHLEHLGLQRCITSKEVLKQLSHLVIHWNLNTLDISQSRGIKGKLSILLQYEFPFLKSLILHDCKLNKTDLETIDLANAQGRLPILEDLHLSENYRLIGNFGMMSSKWIHLKRLKLDYQPNPKLEQKCLDTLGRLIGMYCFPSMQELRLNLTDLTGEDTVVRLKFK